MANTQTITTAIVTFPTGRETSSMLRVLRVLQEEMTGILPTSNMRLQISTLCPLCPNLPLLSASLLLVASNRQSNWPNCQTRLQLSSTTSIT